MGSLTFEWDIGSIRRFCKIAICLRAFTMIREENKHHGHKMKLLWFMGYEQELKTPHR